ncbi:type II secretion system F family protein [Mangrovibrevibacter kandeliae]|uniref:type II secretion system F family protein n=1 Tax=Mangrovibrevibacter kandeliae TaxID=2968473 RepID=UPI00211766DF|nr:type II secretion system F family protein [Aurantimonas sp. CSK15Z-1]MCQ8784105.1 type II secretion system F family protein [Aurantimonas sp. CSK15Z-1]
MALNPTLLLSVLIGIGVLCTFGVVAPPLFARPKAFDSRFSAIAQAGTLGGAAAAPARAGEKTRKRTIQETLKELDEKQKSKARQRGKPSLVIRLRQAQLDWSKQTYVGISAMAGVVSAAIAAVGGLQALACLGFGIAGGLLLPHLFVGMRRGRRFKRFTKEFPTAIDVISRGIKSGLPLVDCIKIVANEAAEPVRGEFKTMVEDQTLGMPMDEAVARLAERVPLPEANFFAIVVGIQSRTGGSLSEALGNLSKVLRERKKMEAKIKAMSTEAKTSGGIIGALPVVVASLVWLTSPAYIELLGTETLGHIVLGCCAVWMTIGILVMRKMINFDF